MTVIRYIHQNPVKAGIVGKPSEWKWSSCSWYYGKKFYPEGLLDRDLILALFSIDKETASQRFKEFNEVENEEKCLDDDNVARLTDEEAKEEIKKLTVGLEVTAIKFLPKNERDEIIKKSKELKA